MPSAHTYHVEKETQMLALAQQRQDWLDALRKSLEPVR